MRDSTTEALGVTLALHVAVAAILFVLGLLAHLFEEKPAVVLELVDLGGSAAETPSTDQPAPADPPPLPEEEPPTPLAELERLVVQPMDPVRPAPEVPPEPEPPPPEPAPQPKPKPPPQPQRSYEDFLRERGPIKPKPVRPATPRPVDVPRITTDFRSELENALSTPRLEHTGVLSAADRSALEQYVAGIQASLQRVFRSQGRAGLVAKIEFTVLPNGAFRNVRVIRGSGDAAFDAAALAAFRQVGRYRPTPDGESYRWTIDFRSLE